VSNGRKPIWIIGAFIALMASMLPAFASSCQPGSSPRLLTCQSESSDSAMSCCSGMMQQATQTSLQSQASSSCCEFAPLSAPENQTFLFTANNVVKESKRVAHSPLAIAVVAPLAPRLLLPKAHPAFEGNPPVLLSLHIPGYRAGRAPPVG
jgi:hypothetical protein